MMSKTREQAFEPEEKLRLVQRLGKHVGDKRERLRRDAIDRSHHLGEFAGASFLCIFAPRRASSPAYLRFKQGVALSLIHI